MKVAILTLYYNSNNYGGNLQSYALVKFIHDYCNVEVEQLSYNQPRRKRYGLRDRLSRIYHRYFKDISDMCGLERRKKTITAFNQSIPHSKKIYTPESMTEALKNYDVFIVGSDQVWNPKWTDNVYLLDFVPKTKYKMAYAVSLGVSNLDEATKEYYHNCLITYNAISVREYDLIELLSPLSSKKIEWLLDPTLLLTRCDWDKICAPRKYKEQYIFTYFLGNSNAQRQLVRDFANRKGIKIINLPHACGYFNDNDKYFGDTKELSASPADFISLIKNATYIFTDSFHASVFSIIYHKNYFVFQRAEALAMGSRIYSLTEMFNMSDRFCDSSEKYTVEYFESLNPIDYNTSFPNYENMLIKSKNFIMQHLLEAKCMIDKEETDSLS